VAVCQTRVSVNAQSLHGQDQASPIEINGEGRPHARQSQTMGMRKKRSAMKVASRPPRTCRPTRGRDNQISQQAQRSI